MVNDEDLICGYLLPDGGEWKVVGKSEIQRWRPEDGLLWVHLHRAAQWTSEYLFEHSRIEAVYAQALLDEETRPRAVRAGENLLLILRGVNLNPGANPEDMISIRLWVEPRRIISTRVRSLLATQDLRESLESRYGPRRSGEFLAALVVRLLERMSGVLETLDSKEDHLEERLVNGSEGELRSELTTIRRQAIQLRRHLAPQREAINRLSQESLPWLEPEDRLQLRESADRNVRYVEDLDAIRERAAVIQDEIVARLSDRMNRNMYMLTLVATVMLPLGVVTGLLGINVDGMPGAQNAPWAFAAVCALMLVIVVVEVWLLRRLKWL